MIIISHNRIINLVNVIAVREYCGPIPEWSHKTDIKLMDNKSIILTINYEDFKRQLVHAFSTNRTILKLTY